MNTQEMGNIYKWAWIVLIVLAVFLGVQTIGALKDLGETNPSYNTISVSGEGETLAVPDIASFTFTVSADAKTVASAQEDVTKKMNAVLAELEKQGIDEKDIKTTDYSVYPRYSYPQVNCSPYSCPSGRQVLDGYTASHNVSVKVRKTDDAGKILGLVGERGATNLSGINFTIDDPEKLTQEARTEAIENAREKAKILSRNLGVKLVRVVSYSDNFDGGVMPYAREGMAYGMGAKDVAVAQSAPAPQLPTGENKIRVIVNVTYEIR